MQWMGGHVRARPCRKRNVVFVERVLGKLLPEGPLARDDNKNPSGSTDQYLATPRIVRTTEWIWSAGAWSAKLHQSRGWSQRSVEKLQPSNCYRTRT